MPCLGLVQGGEPLSDYLRAGRLAASPTLFSFAALWDDPAVDVRNAYSLRMIQAALILCQSTPDGVSGAVLKPGRVDRGIRIKKPQAKTSEGAQCGLQSIDGRPENRGRGATKCTRGRGSRGLLNPAGG